MTDMIVNLHLREMPEGDFLATLPERPEFAVRGRTAGEALERARVELGAARADAADAADPSPASEGNADAGTKSSARFAIPQNGADEHLLRQVMILDHVENEDKLSQRRLAKLLDLNLSTVNQIVKRLVKKGYVKTRRLNGRSVAYYLTPQGFSEKLRLVLSYTHSTIGFFSSVRDLMNVELSRLRDEDGAATVGIVGTGELAEAVYLSAREQGLAVTAIYNSEKAGEVWLGHDVTWPFSVDAFAADVLVRADMRRDGAAALDLPLPADGTGGISPGEGRHVVDLAHLLSNRLSSFACGIDRDERSARDDGEPEVVYG